LIAFVVGKRTLRFPIGLWLAMEGPRPPEGYECDGCSHSPDGWWSWVTHVLYTLVVACTIHDYHYSEEKPLGADWRARMEADAILRRNLRTVILMQGGTRWEAEWIAWLYWGQVRILGDGAWRKGPSRWDRVKEVWGSIL